MLKSVIALLRGAVRLNGSTPVQGEAQLAALSAPGDLIQIEATADTMLLVLSGEAINEPVASYGPFVMNTRAEIQQAITDYQRTRFGGWPWPSDAPVHGRDAGRFARHADGHLEHPARR